METEESSEEPPSPSAAKPECRALNPCNGRGGLAGPVQRRGPLQQEGAAVPYRQLETSLFCLRLMVSCCGPDFEPYFEESLLDLLVRTGQHPSRFVREAGESPPAPTVGSPLERFSMPLAQMLAAGLADTTENWAQVR
jgi:hypothetical protein